MNLVWAMTKRIDISCPCSHTLPAFLVGFWHLKTGEVFGWSRLEKTIPHPRGVLGQCLVQSRFLAPKFDPLPDLFDVRSAASHFTLAPEKKRGGFGESLVKFQRDLREEHVYHSIGTGKYWKSQSSIGKSWWIFPCHVKLLRSAAYISFIPEADVDYPWLSYNQSPFNSIARSYSTINCHVAILCWCSHSVTLW